VTISTKQTSNQMPFHSALHAGEFSKECFYLSEMCSSKYISSLHFGLICSI